jgi:putative SOS response-associated peptidase YedK
MCGRFTLQTPLLDWLGAFFPNYASLWPGVVASLQHQFPVLSKPRYNIAPTQLVWVIAQRNAKSPADEPPEVIPMRWGLLPAWADSTRIAYSMINARCETLFEKPSYRSLTDTHRCILLADGYYEWKLPSEEQPQKQPHWIHRRDTGPIAFAGLWTLNKKLAIQPKTVPEATPQSEPFQEGVLSTTIITTAANSDTQSVHDRMPVIIDPTPESAARWLDGTLTGQAIKDLLATPEAGSLIHHPVSTRVNAVRNQGPELIEPDQ